VFGRNTPMRIWLDPRKALHAFELDPIRHRRSRFARPRKFRRDPFGAVPPVEGQALNATIRHKFPVTQSEAFPPDPCCVRKQRLGGVAELMLRGVEIGSEAMHTISQL